MPPPGRNYDHNYHDSFRADQTSLGLTGSPFDYFWQDVEDNLDADPSNIYVKEVPDSGGFRVYPTLPAHEDIPSCVVYFSIEDAVKTINYFGLERIPDDWTYVPLDF